MREIDNLKEKKITVAMSGGIDSSVTAALLKIKDFNIIGVFMKFWGPKGQLKSKENKCCSSESERRARKVASVLNIPFYVLDFRKKFKKRVVDYFLKEHKKGRTPNPCVVCNKKVKFGLLLEKALGLNSEFVATGHYARIEKNSDSKLGLYRGKDKEKDQSYFLWQLNQRQLQRILFPLGDYEKREVERLAKEFNLPVKDAEESQEICFIPSSINDFLKENLEARPGSIINKEGEKLGEHQGLYHYTLGQRKGIGLSGGPWYVLEKNLKENALVVTKEESDLMKKEFKAEKLNWITEKPRFPLEVKVKVRYGQKPKEAEILSQKNKKCKVRFKRKQRAITPGQSSVFYKNEELLGGGIIYSD